MCEHRLLERHRELLLRLEPDRGLELLLVVDLGQLDHANGDLLARDAEADPLGKLVLAEERAELLGQAVDVDDLTLVEEAGAESRGRGLDQPRRASAGELGSGDEAGLDVEPHDRARLWLEQSHSVRGGGDPVCEPRPPVAASIGGGRGPL